MHSRRQDTGAAPAAAAATAAVPPARLAALFGARLRGSSSDGDATSGSSGAQHRCTSPAARRHQPGTSDSEAEEAAIRALQPRWASPPAKAQHRAAPAFESKTKASTSPAPTAALSPHGGPVEQLRWAAQCYASSSGGSADSEHTARSASASNSSEASEAAHTPAWLRWARQEYGTSSSSSSGSAGSASAPACTASPANLSASPSRRASCSASVQASPACSHPTRQCGSSTPHRSLRRSLRRELERAAAAAAAPPGLPPHITVLPLVVPPEALQHFNLASKGEAASPGGAHIDAGEAWLIPAVTAALRQQSCGQPATVAAAEPWPAGKAALLDGVEADRPPSFSFMLQRPGAAAGQPGAGQAKGLGKAKPAQQRRSLWQCWTCRRAPAVKD